MALLTPLERVCLCCLIQLEIECVFPSSCLWFFHFSSVVMISNYNTVTVLDIRNYDFTSKTCYLVCFHIKRWYSCLCTFRRFSCFLGKHGEILTRSRLIHHDQQRRPSTTDEKQIWGKKMTTHLRRVSGSKSWGFVQSNLHICEQFTFMTSSWLYIYFHKREIGNSRGAGEGPCVKGLQQSSLHLYGRYILSKVLAMFPSSGIFLSVNDQWPQLFNIREALSRTG